MPRLIIKNVVVHAAKADLVNHTVRVSLDLPLNDETLALRSKLAYLAVEKEWCTVTLESKQLPLFEDKPLPDSPNNITDGDEELGGLTTEQFKRGLELAGTEIIEKRGNVDPAKVFDGVMDQLETEKSLGEQVFDVIADKLERPARGRRRQPGTVTMSANGRSVTVTNDQFSKAAQRIEQEGKAAAARSKTKTKKRA